MGLRAVWRLEVARQVRERVVLRLADLRTTGFRVVGLWKALLLPRFPLQIEGLAFLMFRSTAL